MISKKQVDKRFLKFGYNGFISVSKINNFIDYLEKGKIMGKFCSFCSKYFFPPRNDCHICFGSNLDWFEINNCGTLISDSEFKFAPKGFEKELPYSIALLNLGKFKIFGRLHKSISLSNLKIGTKMKIVIENITNKRISYVFNNV